MKLSRFTIIFGIAAMLMLSTSATEIQARRKGKAKAKTTSVSKTANLSVSELFRNNVGRYPMDFNMFANRNLRNRLTRLLGQNHFNILKKYFQTQGPIERTDWLYVVSGGESHNMGENHFDIYYNGRTDKLSVRFTFEGSSFEVTE